MPPLSHHTCGALRATDVDKPVRLSAGPSHPDQAAGSSISESYGITRWWPTRLAGVLKKRPRRCVGPMGGADRWRGREASRGTEKTGMPTGAIEVYIKTEVLGPDGERPMPCSASRDIEEIRLKLPLRRLRREAPASHTS